MPMLFDVCMCKGMYLLTHSRSVGWVVNAQDENVKKDDDKACNNIQAGKEVVNRI